MAGTSGILHSLPHWTIIWSDCRLKLVQERPNVILEIKVGLDNETKTSQNQKSEELTQRDDMMIQ